jgi:hypothetical protein
MHVPDTLGVGARDCNVCGLDRIIDVIICRLFKDSFLIYTTWRRLGGCLINNELDRNWKETVVA